MRGGVVTHKILIKRVYILERLFEHMYRIRKFRIGYKKV